MYELYGQAQKHKHNTVCFICIIKCKDKKKKAVVSFKKTLDTT